MPLDRQPVLQSVYVQLRPLQAEDFDALYAVACDPLIWEQHPASNRYQRSVFQRFFDDGIQSGGALATIDARTSRLIGSTRFHPTPDPSVIEVGWTFLARSHWGGIYNGEMKRLMLQHAFETLESVVFLVAPENYRSRRAVEKLGARPVREQENDEGVASIVYEIRSDDYEPDGGGNGAL